MDALGHETRRLFQFLRRHWLPQPDLNEGFLKSLDNFNRLQQQLRSSENLNRLSREMYPDLKQMIAGPDRKSAGKRVDTSLLSLEEVHEILHIIQTMEIAWMNARMEDFDAHPLNRGWVAVFHRWAMMPSFRKTWPVLRADFSRAFIEYLESRFSLSVSYSALKPFRLPDDAPPQESPDNWTVFDTLRSEFQAEWPEINSTFLSRDNAHLWFVVPSIAMPPDGETSQQNSVPLGFVALLPPRNRKDLEKDGEAQHSCDEQAPELRFWVRPQYRFLGVGRHLLNEFARQMLENGLPEQFAPQGAKVDGKYPLWNCNDTLVTRYFVRTGQEGGRNLRRRMQLGFLYEYSFCRHDDRPYDELTRTGVMQAAGCDHRHPSEYGINRNQTIDAQESLVPTILSTTWHRYFEASRAMSGSPHKFNDYVRSSADPHDLGSLTRRC